MPSALTTLVQDSEQLIFKLKLNPRLVEQAKPAEQLFKTRVPRAFLNQIKPGDINDPLLKQILPASSECEDHADYVRDPLAEQASNPLPGLLHKYYGRVLFIVTGSCAIHCRYCFRRHFPYQDNNPSKAGWEKALDYIQQDSSITEVILSGGDPLMLTDSHLDYLIQAISKIKHVHTLRIHSRIPTAMPSRITDELTQILTQTRLQTIMVIHCNHANEIGPEAQTALNKLHKASLCLLNQSVLLKNINDNPESLINLSQALFANHVLPYYLHLPDKVKGTQHFDVNETRGRQLIKAISAKLPGYLVPKLMRETPGEASKTQVTL